MSSGVVGCPDQSAGCPVDFSRPRQSHRHQYSPPLVVHRLRNYRELRNPQWSRAARTREYCHFLWGEKAMKKLVRDPDCL